MLTSKPGLESHGPSVGLTPRDRTTWGKGMAGRETQRRQGALRHRRRKTVTASELPHEKTAVFPK